jgi:protein-S-isoprenylcysteine O-methyltransferase Ste14
MTYTTVILISWTAFILVWVASAFSVKRDVKGGGVFGLTQRFWLARLVIAALVIFALVRLATGTAHYTRTLPILFEFRELFTLPPFLGWTAAILTALGIAFAIWARIHLGSNWSAAPAMKKDHVLVISGPYRWVRHPIYTGVMLAALGSALMGTFFGISVFAVASILFVSRIYREEAIMLELFPNEYPLYQARTKRLIPFVW